MEEHDAQHHPVRDRHCVRRRHVRGLLRRSCRRGVLARAWCCSRRSSGSTTTCGASPTRWPTPATWRSSRTCSGASNRASSARTNRVGRRHRPGPEVRLGAGWRRHRLDPGPPAGDAGVQRTGRWGRVLLRRRAGLSVRRHRPARREGARTRRSATTARACTACSAWPTRSSVRSCSTTATGIPSSPASRSTRSKRRWPADQTLSSTATTPATPSPTGTPRRCTTRPPPTRPGAAPSTSSPAICGPDGHQLRDLIQPHPVASVRGPGSASSGAGDDAAEGGEVDVPVLRRDPLPGAGPAPVGVAEERLLVVVPAAEPGEVFEFGDPGAVEGVAVIVLEVPAAVAAGHDARFGSRTSRAERRCAGTVYPPWATATTSTPLVSSTLRMASSAIWRANVTGIGPMPGISHCSPATVWPRIRAS